MIIEVRRLKIQVLRVVGGRGSRVVYLSDRGLLCHGSKGHVTKNTVVCHRFRIIDKCLNCNTFTNGERRKNRFLKLARSKSIRTHAIRFNNLKDNEGRRSNTAGVFMARREPRVLTLRQSRKKHRIPLRFQRRLPKATLASCKRLISRFLLYKRTELGRKNVPVRPPSSKTGKGKKSVVFLKGIVK
ncbi:hypothetical protein TNCV_3579461 [Trichonephila clavipes]|nr:hypothetical protein TNCV_3579461 [Trichonephila clavipes]